MRVGGPNVGGGEGVPGGASPAGPSVVGEASGGKTGVSGKTGVGGEASDDVSSFLPLGNGGPESRTEPGEVHGPFIEPAAAGIAPPEARRYPADVSADDRDVGWGERLPSSDRDDEWYLRERPPHHG